MTYKQLFLAFVALSTAFMPSIVFAADANAEWKQLVKQEGCLASSTDINYTVAGSVFEQKTWKDFLVSVQNDNGEIKQNLSNKVFKS